MDSKERYQREPEHDKSKAQGDARTETAWRDSESGKLILLAEAYNPNTRKYEYDTSPARTSYFISLYVFVPAFVLAVHYILYQPCVAHGGNDCGEWYFLTGLAPFIAIVNPLSVILFFALRRFGWKRELTTTSKTRALAFVSGVLGGALGVAGSFAGFYLALQVEGFLRGY